MPVTIGNTKEHGFDQPLGLLSDCHRRVEMFLGALVRVAEEGRGGPLTETQREAVAKALKYFREAAPKHTADEEESLFPRMRALGSTEVDATLDQVAALENQHRRAEELHAESDALFREWYYEGRLPVAKETRLRAVMAELGRIYAEHIRVEDEIVFPLAGRTLDRDAQAAVGREMATRRGVLPAVESDLLPLGKLR